MKVIKLFQLCLLCTVAFSILSCASDDDPKKPAIPLVHLQQGKDPAVLRARAERSPHSTLWTKVRQTCDSSLDSLSYNGSYLPQSEKAIAQIAESCALIGLVWQDGAASGKARLALGMLRSDAGSTEATADYRTVAEIIVHGLNALSWWSHGPGFDRGGESAFTSTLGNLVQEYFDTWYGEQPQIADQVQNAHNVSSAAATAYAALLLRSDPRRESWKTIAYSDLWWLLQNNQSGYLMDKGGAAEGPYFFASGQMPALQFYLAKRQLNPEEETFSVLCWMRGDESCTESEVALELPDEAGRLHRAHRWLRTILLPDGSLPPVDDSLIISNFTGVLAGDLFDDESLVWSWERQELENIATDTDPVNLIYLPDWLPVDPPQEHPSEAIIESGHAALRSTWEADATMMLVLGEGTKMSSPNHEHCDGSSFSIYRGSTALALDPGYLFEDEQLLLAASDAAAHNMYLIDGFGPPERDSLWFDSSVTAAIVSSEFDPRADYVAVRTSYNDAEITRHFIFDGENGFWIIDEIYSLSGEVHEYTFNLHGNGDFDPYAAGATWTTGQAQLAAAVGIVGSDRLYFDSSEFYHTLYKDSATAESHMVMAVTAETENAVFVSHLTVDEAGAAIDDVEFQHYDSAGYLHAVWGNQRITVRGPNADSISFSLLDDVMIDGRAVPGEPITTDARVTWERPGSRTFTVDMTSWCDPGGCHEINPANTEDYEECFTGICFEP